jgi:hypothetical protein
MGPYYRSTSALVSASIATTLFVAAASAQTPTGNPQGSAFKATGILDASGNCKPCHPRQYFELKQAVKSGYRNVSPLFNGFEVAGNFLSGGALRPVYHDSAKKLSDGRPFNSNNFTTPVLTTPEQASAGFCYTCHQALIERQADDPAQREVPEIDTGAAFRPDLLRPLRDYNLLDADGNYVLPDVPGGDPPDGSGPTLSAQGISCDTCHDIDGPDLNRSLMRDGFGDMSLLLTTTIEKVGQFQFGVEPSHNFHVPSNNPDKINFLNNSAFCNTCHDVRIPMAQPGDLQHREYNQNPGASAVAFFRLENLSTEWQTGPLSTNSNPFGHVVKCHDCHTSLYPYSPNVTYPAGSMLVTAPSPGVYPMNYAAVRGHITCNDSKGNPIGTGCDGLQVVLDPTIENSTDGGYLPPLRQVSTHFFTGVDTYLMDFDELKTRIGDDNFDPDDPDVDEYGLPMSLNVRRAEQMKAGVRMDLKQTDSQASLGGTLVVRPELVALTGHRFPAGLSQERTTYVQLSVTDDSGFLLYQSGYQVDKPHPQTGETDPDGNLNDEDLENAELVADPGHPTDVYQPGPETNGHWNEVYALGPDAGPESRVYAGRDEGLVLFRNSLIKIFMPGEKIGRTDADGNPIVAATPHYEETVSADLANTVDNYRSLPPFQPRTFRYNVTLPTKQQLDEMGVQIKGPLHVHAQVNYLHFPPQTLRFIIRTTSSEGPSGVDMGLFDEGKLDQFLRNVTAVATADATVQLAQ